MADWLTLPGLYAAVGLTYVLPADMDPILFHHHLLTMGQPVMQWLACGGLTSNQQHLMAQVNLPSVAFTGIRLTVRASGIDTSKIKESANNSPPPTHQCKTAMLNEETA